MSDYRIDKVEGWSLRKRKSYMIYDSFNDSIGDNDIYIFKNPFIIIKAENLNKYKEIINSEKSYIIFNSKIYTINEFNKHLENYLAPKQGKIYKRVINEIPKFKNKCYKCNKKIKIELNHKNNININEKNIFLYFEYSKNYHLKIVHFNCLEHNNLFKLVEENSAKLLSDSL